MIDLPPKLPDDARAAEKFEIVQRYLVMLAQELQNMQQDIEQLQLQTRR